MTFLHIPTFIRRDRYRHVAMLATLAIMIAPLVVRAQTPPTPPVRPVPPVQPTPRVPRAPRAPTPVPAPIPSPYERGSFSIAPMPDFAMQFGFDPAEFSARFERAFDTQGLAEVAERAAMSASIAGVRASAFAAATVQDALQGVRFNFDFQGGRGVDDSRVSSRPPEAWQPDDPADSLYREARKALSGDSYRRAAELFRRIRDQYPKSTYAPDAPYWEAFALQRLGNESDLRSAQDALKWQQKEFPKAATRGDAAVLSTRIDAALARRGNQQSYANLLGVVNQPTSSGCPRDDQDERVTALNALANMDSAQFLPIIKRALGRREPCTQALRRTAVWLYARSKASDAPQVLMNVARTDPDREVRDQAILWMANVPTDEAANMLIELAVNGSDLDLRKRAVYALSRAKSPRAAATLKEIAADSKAPTELRSEALQWYMNGPGRTSDDAMSLLKDVYGKADDQRLRERVLQIIANKKNDEAREFLTAIAQNDRENIDTRRQALRALQNAGATTAQIGAVYDKGANDVEIRKQAISVLAGLRNGAGTDKLLDIARNEKNLELRKQAVSYLSRTNDPRAIELLKEIVDR